MKISQREAHRLRKRNDELELAFEKQRRTYGQDWFRSVNIATTEVHPEIAATIRTARRLSHAVVVIGDEGNQIRFMALPHPKE